jgi:predicted acetyltransferase
VFEEWRRRQPGAMSRTEAWWDMLCLDVPERRGDMTGAFYVVWRRDASSPVEGFARYRLKGGWRDGLADGRVEVLDVSATCDEAEAALWRYLVSIDLMSTLEMFPAPIDHPLEWWLIDRRQLRTDEFIDDQWVRLIDIPRALSSRRYATSDAFTIEVHDDLLGENSGTYRVEGSINGATCERIDTPDAPTGATDPTDPTDPPDLRMKVSALGSLYLGGVRASSLHRGGQIEAESRAMLMRADAFFAAEKEPFNPTMY